jgi:hypothetical protein
MRLPGPVGYPDSRGEVVVTPEQLRQQCAAEQIEVGVIYQDGDRLVAEVKSSGAPKARQEIEAAKRIIEGLPGVTRVRYLVPSTTPLAIETT